ncbi:MAG: heme exporter protein CcmB [Actinomycetota bacterium]
MTAVEVSSGQPVAARGPGFVSKTTALVAKDLKIELRARDTLPPMLAFSIAVTLLLAFTLPTATTPGRPVELPIGAVPLSDVLAGFLWITILFAGLVGFARTFEVERRDGAIDSLVLVPVDRSALFIAKAAANLAFVLMVEIILVPVFILLFQIDLAGNWWLLVLVLLLGDLGFVSVGTLFAALAARTTSRELMLPILALPVLVPLFIAGVELTSDLFSATGAGAIGDEGWFGILLAFDAIVGIVGALVFEYALDG